MRILAGGPTADPSAAHARLSRATLEAQTVPLDIAYAVDDGADPGRVTEDDHQWSRDSVLRVARLRQEFIDRARDGGYDYALMVDDDLMLAPDVVARLVEVSAPVAFGVFWTRWANVAAPMPQVWDVHPYHFHSDPQRFRVGVHEVYGGGACTLFDLRELPREVCYYPPVPGLWGHPDWWGEDRHFCVRANVIGVRLVAVGGLTIHHAYGAADRTEDAIRRECPWMP